MRSDIYSYFGLQCTACKRNVPLFSKSDLRVYMYEAAELRCFCGHSELLDRYVEFTRPDKVDEESLEAFRNRVRFKRQLEAHT